MWTELFKSEGQLEILQIFEVLFKSAEKKLIKMV